MNEEISELLKKALALPAAARAALAGSLLESLDETVDPGAEEEWQAEIARRIRELDSGKVKPVAWAKARRQISAVLSSPVTGSAFTHAAVYAPSAAPLPKG
jgi:putative addiction module component (TIGR02574 family)